MTQALSIPEKQETALVKPETTKERLALAQFDPYQGVSAKSFKAESVELLLAPIDENDVEIRPDGIVYLPEIKYRRVLNKAFGPGAWALVPRSDYQMQDNTITREYALFVLGRFVSEARGEQDYIPNNPNMTYATAAEGCKSNALMRCCKDLGIASELWDPGYIERWKAKFAVQVWREKSRAKGPQWRRTDRQPFYDETGIVKAKNGSKKPAGDDWQAAQQPPYQGEKPYADYAPAPVPPAADTLNNEMPWSDPPPANEPTAPGAPPSFPITEKQRKRMYAIAKGRGISDTHFKEVVEAAGFASSKDVTMDEYETLCSAFASWTPEEHARICAVLEGRREPGAEG